MSGRLDCGNCGGRIDLPDGFDRAKIRCPACGVYSEVDPKLRSRPLPAPSEDEPPPRPGRRSSARSDNSPKQRTERIRPQTDPFDSRPKFDGEEGAGNKLLEGTQDEEDDLPYAVPGDGLATCSFCQGELPLGAKLCVHCGRDLARGQRSRRVHQPMKYRWEEGWSFSIRLQLIVVMLGVSTFLLVAGFINQGVYKDAGATVTFLFLGTVNTLLQVFLIGSYDRFELTRNSKGKTTLTRTRRIAFFELPPTKMDWKESVGLVVVGSHAAGLFEWLFCAYLATLGLVPGIIFYVLELRPDRFELNLCDVYGASEGLLFRTKDRDQAVEVMKVVVDATGLSCRNLL